jgi:cytochrome c peroxidase
VRRGCRCAEAAALTLALLLGRGAEAHEPAQDAGETRAPAPGSYALPPLGPAGDGAVLTSEAEPARLHDVLGDRLVLLSLIYTHCVDAEGCPMATAVLQRVGHRIGADPALRDAVRLVSLSFDPERDTPEVMRRYGESFARSGAEWVFLTAESEAALAPLLEAYGQTRLPERDAEGRALGTFSHLLRVFLIDREGRIRNVYGASFLDPELLEADLRTLLLEADSAAAGPAPAPLRGHGHPADLLSRVSRPPLGLPPVRVPADNPLTRRKVELGRRLFFDRRLSLNDTFSCAMCHVPEQGFASNELATAVGIEGRTVRRNAPTIYNVAYLERLFLDGRENRLEQQVWGPLLAANEMGNPAVGALLEKVRGLPGYEAAFQAAFPDRGLALETLGMAIASYERTLVSGGSPFDRWYYARQPDALDAAAQRGFALFAGRAGCSGCHPVGPEYALFTDGDLHNTGIGYRASMGGAGGAGTQRVQVAPDAWLDVDRSLVAQVSEPPPADLGRYEITLDPADRWKYRTPSLRNVALTAPYMHDGSLGTLREVVAFYDRGGVPNEGLDPRIRPLGLTPGEIDDLVAFLESLTGDDVDLLVSDAFAAPVGDVGAPEAEAR